MRTTSLLLGGLLVLAPVLAGCLSFGDAGTRSEPLRRSQPSEGQPSDASASGPRVSIEHVDKGLIVQFRAVVAPPEAAPSDYFWDLGDGSVSRESSPIHEYAEAGPYLVTVRVTVGAELIEARAFIQVGGEALATALAERSFAVIAVVDTGINPYHEEFRDAAFTAHPSTYITGYPEGAEALELTLDSTQYQRSLTEDGETWGDVDNKDLHWIPGTRIIGAISIVKDGRYRILDEDGHGTATAALAAGATFGTCAGCLIVAVEGLGPEPLSWAMKQPWIDVVSNSWEMCVAVCEVNPGVFPAALFPAFDDTRRAVEKGQSIVFASGNGMLNSFTVPQISYTSATKGPDWLVTVGAADAASGATVVGTGRPVDVVSFGYEAKSASHTSYSAAGRFSGTSFSAPMVSGALGQLIMTGRDALNDTEEGPRGKGVVARGEVPGDLGAGSVLADGVMGRAEAERLVFHTARAATGSGFLIPPMLPDSPAAFLYAGYGVVDYDTVGRASEVALGLRPEPQRSIEDQWAAIDSSVRIALYGSWNSGHGGFERQAYSDSLALEDVNSMEEIEAVWLAAVGTSAALASA